MISFSFGLFTCPVSAATKEISEISPGSVVSVNGVKFVKLNNNNQFVAVAPSVCPSFASGMYMQDFTSQMCATAPTPSGTDYFPIGFLIDRRDNKVYEVRKFADGNCWMVDNLAYGGADLRSDGLDGCLKTIFCGRGYLANGSCTSGDIFDSVVDKIAPGLYGDCRYPYSDVLASDVHKYGYSYSWQAAVQDAQAYQNTDYQPSQPTQGICPDGWYLPTGGPNGQFQALHVAAGQPATGFWQPGGAWDGVYIGYVTTLGAMGHQGTNGYYLSSTQKDSNSAYGLTYYLDSGLNTNALLTKAAGYGVRCLKTP